MNFYLGCAVWSYKGWLGDFYPAKSASSQLLNLYAQRLTTVEGNTTFYATPQPSTIERWREQTPPGFKFCLKLPREVTHGGLLEPKIQQALNFHDLALGLGDRLGAIFAQLPPSYSPAYLEDLTCFLRALPRQQTAFALEIRHPQWFETPHREQLIALLTQLGVAKVLLDTRPIYECEGDPQIKSERRKPKLPLQPDISAPYTLIRFISHPQRDLNHSYLEWWAIQVATWLEEGKQVYFFVHCPVEEQSPGTARYFQQILEKKGISIPPLPWNQLVSEPQQLNLFELGT